MKRRAVDSEYYFTIVLKDSGKVIGEVFSGPEGVDPENETFDTFSPCWMLNLSYTGKGYAYEAARAYFEHLFSEKGARRIYAYTEDYNLSCQRLCERLGMRREGMFLEFVSFVNGPDGAPLHQGGAGRHRICIPKNGDRAVFKNSRSGPKTSCRPDGRSILWRAPHTADDAG